MKGCGAKKLGKLEQHFSSTSHKADNRKEAIQLEQEKDFNKNIVIMLFHIAQTLARQGVAFRSDGDESGDNFMQLVKLLSRHNPLMDRWIKETSKRTMRMMTEIKSDDQAINSLIDSAVSFATLLRTNPESYFKKHHHKRLCPKRIDSKLSTEVEFTIHLFYQRKFKLILDTLITLSNSNLKQCIYSVQPLFQLFSQPLDKSNITLENITNSLSLFPVDSTGSNLKDLDLVQTQREILFNMLQDDSRNFKSLMKKSEEVKHILPCANLLCRLALTSPMTVASNTLENYNAEFPTSLIQLFVTITTNFASCERSLYCLLKLKTYLRTTIGQSRLNSLGILQIEHETSSLIDKDEVMEKFSASAECKGLLLLQ
ncbi:hypothetical protein QTP88_008985 [Uroleucon formosanum]